MINEITAKSLVFGDILRVTHSFSFAGRAFVAGQLFIAQRTFVNDNQVHLYPFSLILDDLEHPLAISYTVKDKFEYIGECHYLKYGNTKLEKIKNAKPYKPSID